MFSNLGKSRVLLVGDKSFGKTSLAFKSAYDCAANGETPLFICNKNKIEGKLPLVVNVQSSNQYYSPEVLSRINMKYVTAVTELKALIAGLHCFEPRPTLIVIDDFTLFLDPLYSVARNDSKFIESCIMVSAVLTDVLDYFDSNVAPASLYSQHASLAKLIIADECSEPAFILAMQQCVNSVYKIQRSLSNASFASSFNPHPNRISEGESLQLVYKKRWSREFSGTSSNEDVIVYKSIQLTGGLLIVTV